MMPLWWAVSICLLAWSSGAFFGAGVAGRRAPAWSNTQRTGAHRSKRDAEDSRRHGAGWRLASLVVLAGVVWLAAQLVLAEVSPAPWLQ